MQLHNENLIKKWESLRLEAYLPTPNDVWTIGWGHTHGVKRGDKITKTQAQRFFESDVQWAEDVVNESVRVGLTQNQFDALVSLAFNIGAGAFRGSTVVKRLNAGNYEGAAEALTWWNKQDGKTLRGLVRRRAQEKEYFLSNSEHKEPIKEEEKSLTPKDDNQDGFKSLLKSKELWGGVSAALTGGGAFLGGLESDAQTVLSVGLCVALLGFGGFILWNRVRARSKGER